MSTALRTYYRGHSLVAMRDEAAGQNSTFHFDHQGTTQFLTNQAGVVTDRFAADAWGVEVKRTGSSINRHWYVGAAGWSKCAGPPRWYAARNLLRRGPFVGYDPATGRLLQPLHTNGPRGDQAYLALDLILQLSTIGGMRRALAGPIPMRDCKCLPKESNTEDCIKKFCGGMKDAKVIAEILQCARDAEIEINPSCLQRWCDAGRQIRCMAENDQFCLDTLTARCKDICTGEFVEIPVPPRAGNDCSSAKDPPVDTSIQICCFWFTEWNKRCQNKVSVDPNATVFHELGHLCAKCVIPMAHEARYDKFGACVARVLRCGPAG